MWQSLPQLHLYKQTSKSINYTLRPSKKVGIKHNVEQIGYFFCLSSNRTFRFTVYVIILILPLFHNNIVISCLEKNRTKKDLQNEKLLLTCLSGEQPEHWILLATSNAAVSVREKIFIPMII